VYINTKRKFPFSNAGYMFMCRKIVRIEVSIAFEKERRLSRKFPNGNDKKFMHTAGKFVL